MTDIEAVRCALNAVAHEYWNAWDAFNRIVGELARLRDENKHLRETNSGRPSAELYEAHTAELRADIEALRAAPQAQPAAEPLPHDAQFRYRSWYWYDDTQGSWDYTDDPESRPGQKWELNPNYTAASAPRSKT